MIKKFFTGLQNFLNHPLRVLIVCGLLAFMSLVMEGSLFQLWSLHRDFQDIQSRKTLVQEKIAQLEMKIKKTNDPDFLELEIRNRFDFVGEGDLIFIFSGEEAKSF